MHSPTYILHVYTTRWQLSFVLVDEESYFMEIFAMLSRNITTPPLLRKRYFNKNLA